MARQDRQRAAEIKNALEDMNENHLMCRDFGHSWRPYTAEYIPQRKQYLETLVCRVCKSLRRRLLDRTGQQLGSSYTYAEGYQMQGMGRLSGADRDAVRLASLAVVIRKTEATQEQPTLRAVK